jgi:hypothetical protein
MAVFLSSLAKLKKEDLCEFKNDFKLHLSTTELHKAMIALSTRFALST